MSTNDKSGPSALSMRVNALAKRAAWLQRRLSVTDSRKVPGTSWDASELAALLWVLKVVAPSDYEARIRGQSTQIQLHADHIAKQRADVLVCADGCGCFCHRRNR